VKQLIFYRGEVSFEQLYDVHCYKLLATFSNNFAYGDVLLQ